MTRFAFFALARVAIVVSALVPLAAARRDRRREFFADTRLRPADRRRLAALVWRDRLSGRFLAGPLPVAADRRAVDGLSLLLGTLAGIAIARRALPGSQALAAASSRP